MAATALDMKALNIPLPPEAKNELVIHTEEDDDRMWVPRGEGVWFRPLMYNVTQGSWVNLRARPARVSSAAIAIRLP